MRIAVGCDHAGFHMKQDVVQFLTELGHQVSDFGCSGTDPVDYPDYAHKVSLSVQSGRSDLGILVCGTGMGMSIAANKVPGIRAVTCSETFSARCSREHNDANVLCLGARVIGPGLAREIVASWLSASFLGGRHQRRVDKIVQIEQDQRAVRPPEGEQNG